MSYIVDRARPDQLPSLRRLATESGLVKSGPPQVIEDSEFNWSRWVDRDNTLTIVARLEDGPDKEVVAAAQVCLDMTYYRAGLVNLHGVATLPEHEGNGLATIILCRLFYHAAFRWKATRVEWICEDVPERQRAREWYKWTFGVDFVRGTNCMFRIPFPWTPPTRIAAHYNDSITTYVPAASL